MDDDIFWMWEKQMADVQGVTVRRTSHNITDAKETPYSAYDVSWEEKAFAEDAAGPLGGCIWPPRSYSCNFCAREFRSAQALGGHMNVHRRDRAKLKQSLCAQDAFDQHQPSNQLQPGIQSQKPLVAPHVPSQVCDLAYNPSPNPNPTSFDIPAPTSLSLKISSPSATGYNISVDQEPTYVQKGPRELKQLWSKNMVDDQNIHTSGLKIEADKRVSQILKYMGKGALMHCDKPEISVSLNLFLFQTQSRKHSKNESAEAEDDDQNDGYGDYNTHRKRTKPTAEESSTVSSSYIKSSFVERLDAQQKILPVQRSSSFVHDLDLELRLGERPKVK